MIQVRVAACGTYSYLKHQIALVTCLLCCLGLKHYLLLTPQDYEKLDVCLWVDSFPNTLSTEIFINKVFVNLSPSVSSVGYGNTPPTPSPPLISRPTTLPNNFRRCF
ncbi:unnamed protein product [Ectocarpus sp. 12 AP-2014]